MKAILFVLVTLVVFALPLLPALLELRRGSDAQALPVPVDHDGDPRRFALNFRALVADGPRARVAEPERDRLRPLMSVSDGNLKIRPGHALSQDLYCRGSVDCRRGARVRAILSDRLVRLGRDVAVSRWVHGRAVVAEDRNLLYGRVTADVALRVAGRAIFERLNAPTVAFGRRVRPSARSAERPPRVIRQGALPGERVASQSTAERTVYAGDLRIPADSIVRGNLVVHGSLRVEDNVEILGSVKARGSVRLGRDVRIAGAAVAADRLIVGPRSIVAGPAIGERYVVLGPGARVGDPGRPASVSAERIDVHDRVVVHGTLWARTLGRAVGVRSRPSRP